MAIEAVIHDYIQILSRVGNARVTYIRRTHNYEAHELLQEARVNGPFFRQGNAPQFVLDSCLCMNSNYCNCFSVIERKQYSKSKKKKLGFLS